MYETPRGTATPSPLVRHSRLAFNSHLVLIQSLQETYEQKRSEHLAELQKKEEEMRQMFVVRVKEKETELKDAEKEVSKSKQNASSFH